MLQRTTDLEELEKPQERKMDMKSDTWNVNRILEKLR
jgi:hypothetical protein